jgi:predicted Rossmann fold flavoprotein
MLERECTAAGVHVFLGTNIESVGQADGFFIETSKGSFHAESLVVATGGLSIPKMGATAFGYTLASQFGLKVVKCRPGLVPLVFNEQDTNNWCDLTGLSIEVIATTGTGRRPTTFREKMLITHRGLSGPAMLQISSYWQDGATLRLDLAPDRNVTAPLLVPNTRRDPGTALRALHLTFPGRLAERWFDQYPPADWTNTSLTAMEQQIHNWQITPAGTEGYTKAEVTTGGVDTAELDAKTMQSRKVPGLFFIGEVVDVTGWLGGYNFQWAWASGVVAGEAA